MFRYLVFFNICVHSVEDEVGREALDVVDDCVCVDEEILLGVEPGVTAPAPGDPVLLPPFTPHPL